jgi:1-pyrroline-5-carboxylate dehydrogenase
VLGREPRLRARVALERGRAIGPSDDAGAQGRRRARFPQLRQRVIDQKAFTKISGYLDDAKKNARVLQGGTAKGDDGYFIHPTLIQTDDPGYRTMCEEIFGPVVTAYVYPDAKWHETLAVVDRTSPYAPHRCDFQPRPQGRAGSDQRSQERRPATSTSTTSPPARSSASSPSAARAARGPTTRPGRS